MIDSYFFIPGDKPKYLNKIKDFNADFFVIDLEDSVSNNNKEIAMNNILDFEFSEQTFLRIPLYDNSYTENQIYRLIKKFNGNIVLPKFKSSNDLERLVILGGEIKLKIIILIENPLGLINLNETLSQYNESIYGIGFGSHDFCAEMGFSHTYENLDHYKRQLILLSKAYDKKYIDGVDLNIRDLTVFEKECITAFEIGADGKFIIHPSQLLKMQTISYMSENEINKVKEVYEKMISVNLDDIDIIEVNGVVYEKPHLKRIERLIKKLK